MFSQDPGQVPITAPTASYYTSVADLSLPLTREGTPQGTGKLIIYLDIHRAGPVLVCRSTAAGEGAKGWGGGDHYLMFN